MPRGQRNEAVFGVSALTPPVKNAAASVRQRLLNLARECNESFDLVLTKFGLERLLYRISQSPYRDKLILKGALLFELWTAQRYRPTRDADFLATGDNSPEAIIAMFQEICSLEVPDDGVRFDPATVKAVPIIEDADYEGISVTSHQWAAFTNRNRAFVKEESLEAMCRKIESFLLPILSALTANEPFNKQWAAGGPWV